MGTGNSYESKLSQNKDFEQYIKDIKSGKKQMENGSVINIDNRSVTDSDNKLLNSYILSLIPSNPQITFWQTTYR